MRALAVIVVSVVVVSCGKSEDRPAGKPGAAPRSTDYCRGRAVNAAQAGSATTLGTVAPPASGSSSVPAHTFSIVARDPVSGDLGVAVQSHYFSVGSAVTWAEPGVGAVATQANVDRSYGPLGLELMQKGVSAPDALAQLLARDKASAMRQVGMIDAQGRVASHTGAQCIAAAASHVGVDYAVQANIMANDTVVPAMAAAFEHTTGDLADRMLAALDAAQAAGGDLRGCQSAALLVVSGTRTATPWNDRKLDLRVEDSGDPLAELRRLVIAARAYDQVNQGDLAVEKNDLDGALGHYSTAQRMLPDNAELVYWTAVTLAPKDMAKARPLFERAFAEDPAWRELTRRLPAAGLLAQPLADQIVR